MMQRVERLWVIFKDRVTVEEARELIASHPELKIKQEAWDTIKAFIVMVPDGEADLWAESLENEEVVSSTHVLLIEAAYEV